MKRDTKLEIYAQFVNAHLSIYELVSSGSNGNGMHGGAGPANGLITGHHGTMFPDLLLSTMSMQVFLLCSNI